MWGCLVERLIWSDTLLFIASVSLCLPAGMSCTPLTVTSNTYCNTLWVLEWDTAYDSQCLSCQNKISTVKQRNKPTLAKQVFALNQGWSALTMRGNLKNWTKTNYTKSWLELSFFLLTKSLSYFLEINLIPQNEILVLQLHNAQFDRPWHWPSCIPTEILIVFHADLVMRNLPLKKTYCTERIA